MIGGQMKRLDGKSAVITGGASGIGKATARLFLEEGARVTIADIDEKLLANSSAELRKVGQEVETVKADVRSVADAARIVSAAIARFGRLDIVFCNAGITSMSPIESLDEAEWDRVIDTNLKGQFTMVKAAVPQMKSQGGGVIITMGSEMGIVAVPESPAYNASKGGVIMFTKSIALDLITHNIRVNALCPGVTQTPLLEREVLTSPDPERTRREQAQWAPIKRIADPAEIARGALFLASDESSFAVGSSLVLDGGYTAK
jgi:NAD(P)-dependent dehydrogenase (short-subunit alcohol dehydrogenase family)